MKKYLFVLVFALVACSCIGVVAKESTSGKDRSKETKVEGVEKTKNQPEFGWFYYKDKAYRIDTAEQQAFVEAHKEWCDVEVRAILEMLGVVEKKNYTCKDVMNALANLEKNALDLDIINEIDKIAGACDKQGGSGMDYYFYETIDGVSFKVQNATVNRVIKSGEEYTNDCIYSNLLGFNADGWTKEEMFELIDSDNLLEKMNLKGLFDKP